MSRKATLECVGKERRAYLSARSKAVKKRILDNFCDVYGFERKYAIKLLTGNRKYKEHSGRGRTYGKKARELLKRVWRATNCLCTKYLRADIGRYLRELGDVEHVPWDAAEAVTGMSASTMDRILRGEKRTGPGSLRRNRRSGRNQFMEYVECRSGELEMGCDVGPGSIQIDTVALCGGSTSDNFFWILTATDRRTQWFEMYPVWNRGAAETMEALEILVRRFPFRIYEIHCDNGSEFINAHLLRFVRKHRSISFSRSRPARKNDNAHIEQKNGSVVRGLFGEMRVDDPGLKPGLVSSCLEWSDFVNYGRPCVMLVSRIKRNDGKGSVKRYDSPRTPADRVLESGCKNESTEKRLRKTKASLNSIELSRKIVRRVERIRRKQAEYEKSQTMKSCHVTACGLGRDLALRAAPSGSSLPSAARRDARTSPGTPPHATH